METELLAAVDRYKEALDSARKIIGSFASIGRVCGGISGEAVRQWYGRGCPPRTEYTGETDYASLISKATRGAVKRDALRPEARKPKGWKHGRAHRVVAPIARLDGLLGRVLERAIEIVGSQQEIARLLGVSLQAVNQWATGKRRLPPKRAFDIQELTGGLVTAASLRPDLAEIFAVPCARIGESAAAHDLRLAMVIEPWIDL